MEVSERLAESPWVGTMPQRAREVLAFAEHDSLKRPEKELRFADIYHSANRYAVSSGSCTPIILPSSLMFDMERRRYLLGRLQQFPFLVSY